MGESIIQRAFAGGELSPALGARADLAKYTTGLKTCRNFLIQRHGGVANRPGTRFVNACKTLSASVQLLRYVSEVAGQSLLIEGGPGYLRFYQNGALVTLTGVAAYNGATAYQIGDIVVSGGVNYYNILPSTGVAPPNIANWYPMPANILELPTPFTTFNWSQSGRTITLTSWDAAPRELIYVSLTHWVIRAVATKPALLPPQGVNLVVGAAGTRAYGYVVTSGAIGTYEESEASAQVINLLGAAPSPDKPNVLTWTPTVGAAEYYIYADPYDNGTYGFIGTATGAATFNDPGFTPDFQQTPPIPVPLFPTANDYPLHSGTFQQRRFFANTKNLPDGVNGSRVGFPSNFGVSSPLQDDDAISFQIAANEHNPVRHLVGLDTLVVLTDAGEWSVAGIGGVLSPSTIDARQGAWIGACDVRPVVVGNILIYLQARRSIVRDLQVNLTSYQSSMICRDLTIFSGHLFDGFEIVRMGYQQVPHSIVWCVRNDGTLLGLTYIQDQDMWGWTRHDTMGGYVDVCVVPEDDEDAVYVIVVRDIGGVPTPYIERFASRVIINFNADAFFVDAGLTYNGAPVSAVGGLGHLEGQVVAVVGDGKVIFDGDPASANAATFTVHAGGIGLPTPCSIVHVGLPIRFAEIETLDLDVAGSAIRDNKKKITNLTILVDDSSQTWQAGPDPAHLTPYQLKPWEAIANETTGAMENRISAAYTDGGRLFIRQPSPLPLTILGVIPNVEVGG